LKSFQNGSTCENLSQKGLKSKKRRPWLLPLELIATPSGPAVTYSLSTSVPGSSSRRHGEAPPRHRLNLAVSPRPGLTPAPRVGRQHSAAMPPDPPAQIPGPPAPTPCSVNAPCPSPRLARFQLTSLSFGAGEVGHRQWEQWRGVRRWRAGEMGGALASRGRGTTEEREGRVGWEAGWVGWEGRGGEKKSRV
jgi:hypothetical protein